MSRPDIVIVAAMSAKNRSIGMQNKLLWHIPDDLKRYKELTLGHPVILGRKTFESILEILGKPLPGRTNIVVTRDKDYKVPEGVVVTHSLDEALDAARSEDPNEIHISGGGDLWVQALPMVDKIYSTKVFDEQEADTFFPPFENQFEIKNEHAMRAHNEIQYQWVDYERIK